MSANDYITKNIPKPEQKLENIPYSLQRRRQNFIEAGYNYRWNPREQSYIEYNSLRLKRSKQDIINDVVKIYRLMDRNSGKEWLVWIQTSKLKDFSNNLRKNMVEERYGVVDNPKTVKILNEDNEVIDIQDEEVENDFYIPFDKEKVIDLFKNTRITNNIGCYIAYTKPYKMFANDFTENKLKIEDQNLFIVADFEELENLNPKLNQKETFNLRRLANKLMVHIENKEQLKKENHPALKGDYNDLKQKEAQIEQNEQEAERVQKEETETNVSKNVTKDQNPFATEITAETKASDIKESSDEKGNKTIENKSTSKSKTLSV